MGPIVDMAARQGETVEATQLLGVGGYDATSALLEIRSGVECQTLSEEKEEVEEKEKEKEKEGMKMAPTYLGFYPSTAIQAGEDEGVQQEQEGTSQGTQSGGDWSTLAGEVVVSYPTCTQFYEVQPTQYGQF